MAVDLISNRLNKSVSETMRLVISLGVDELERQHSGHKKRTKGVVNSQKKDAKLLEAINTFAQNELTLMALHHMRKGENISLKELLEHGYAFGCQVSETSRKVEIDAGFMRREIHSFRTVWLRNYGLEELPGGLFKVLKRD